MKKDLSENGKNVLEGFKALSDEEKDLFIDKIRIYTIGREIPDVENKKITQEEIRDLHYFLVNSTIKYIKEHGLTEIDAVCFNADCLQESAKHGKWCSCTDSSLYLEALPDEEGRHRLGWSM